MPYLLTGNIGLKKIGILYGANYQISNTKSKTEGSSTSNLGSPIIIPPFVEELSSVAIDNRVGIYTDVKYVIAQICFIKFVLNLFPIGIKTKSESSQTTASGTTLTKSDTKTTTKSMGYGPFMSINYNVWKNISVGTEAALYYVSGSSNQTGSSYESNAPNSPFGTFTYVSQDQSGKTTFSGTEVRIPLTLFVYFKF